MAAHPVGPKKSLGQNFLIDPIHRERIVGSAGLTRDDVVLEIGAGDGSLTALIAGQAGRVVAVELDDRLIPALEARFGANPRVTVVRGDIMGMPIEQIWSTSHTHTQELSNFGDETAVHPKVVANLPYYITSAVIRKLLEAEAPPDLLVLTVQLEVARRIVARPPDMNLLAVSVQFYCDGEIVDRIPATAFRPQPKVESAVVRLVRRGEPLLPRTAAGSFFRVVRAGFSQPRKQLRNALASGMEVSPTQTEQWLLTAGISSQRRAETLTLGEWCLLRDAVLREANGSPP